MGNDMSSRLAAAAPAELDRLGPQERERYVVHAHRLIERVSWEATRDFQVDQSMIAIVAAHAALLAAGFEPRTDPFRHVTSVVIHPSTIVSTEVRPGPVRGVVTDGPDYRAGQAGHGRGPILLDWRTVLRDVADPNSGVNVVYHEFAHKLDGLDGVIDGVPPLRDARARADWDQTFGTNFRRLKRRGADPVVRIYGATSPAEYFAVTTELLFTRPVDLRRHLPRVYDQLSVFYNQDPAARR